MISTSEEAINPSRVGTVPLRGVAVAADLRYGVGSRWRVDGRGFDAHRDTAFVRDAVASTGSPAMSARFATLPR